MDGGGGVEVADHPGGGGGGVADHPRSEGWVCVVDNSIVISYISL